MKLMSKLNKKARKFTHKNFLEPETTGCRARQVHIGTTWTNFGTRGITFFNFLIFIPSPYLGKANLGLDPKDREIQSFRQLPKYSRHSDCILRRLPKDSRVFCLNRELSFGNPLCTLFIHENPYKWWSKNFGHVWDIRWMPTWHKKVTRLSSLLSSRSTTFSWMYYTSHGS